MFSFSNSSILFVQIPSKRMKVCSPFPGSPSASNSISWVDSNGTSLSGDGGPKAVNAHLSLDFVESVILGETLADVSKLAFRDPSSFVAGNLHLFTDAWIHLAEKNVL